MGLVRTMYLKCGCYHTKAGNVVREVGHCNEHARLFSDRKSLKEMAEEIDGIAIELMKKKGLIQE